jgi:Transglutaminase-like superfamily
MQMLTFRAYLELIRFDFYLARKNFPALYEQVRGCEVQSSSPSGAVVAEVCRTIDLACIWYWKEVLCLQRSAATVCLLRRNGVAAEMVIGVQQAPFKSHAWVEVDGEVVNDKPYIAEMYLVLERC